MMKPVEHPGYYGCFTRHEAPEAEFKNGARIQKAWGERGDATPVGTQGTVLGSIHAPGVGTGYFVEWDNRPRVAVFVARMKIIAAVA